jgi:potassium-transporting ATPase potassium-binding subunit
VRVDPDRDQDWKAYARSLLAFSLVSWLALYLVCAPRGSTGEFAVSHTYRG